MEVGNPLQIAVRSGRQVHAQGQNARGVEAGSGIEQLDEAARHEPRADHQHHRDRHLCHHEQAPDPFPPLPGGGSTRSVLERASHIGARQAKHRCQAEEQPREAGGQECHEQNPSVHRDLVEPWQVLRPERHQQIHAARGEEAAQDRTHSGEYQAFREKLASEAGSSGPQRRAQSDLGPPIRHAREQQVDDVYARHEHQQTGRPEQHQQGGSGIPDHGVVKRKHGRRIRPVRARILLFESACHTSDVRARRGQIHVGSQPTYYVHPAGVATWVGEQVAVQPETGATREIEARLHHPHDGVLRLLDGQRPSKHLRIAGESAHPEPVAQHDRLGRVGRPVALHERATDQGRAAEHAEEVSARPRTDDLDRRAVGIDQRELGLRVCRQVREAAVAGLKVSDIGGRHEAALDAAFCVRRPDAHEVVRRFVRQGLKQYGVHDAENGRHGPDAQCDGEHRDRREGRMFREVANRVANVFHRVTRARRCATVPRQFIRRNVERGGHVSADAP